MRADSDTPVAVERMVIDGYRRMSATRKLERVVAMNRALDQLARARIRAEYRTDLSERELLLRLAALRIDRELMVAAFGWDPRVQGL